MRGSTKIPLLASIMALAALPEGVKAPVEYQPVVEGAGKFRSNIHSQMMHAQQVFKRRRLKNRVGRSSRQRNRRG